MLIHCFNFGCCHCLHGRLSIQKICFSTFNTIFVTVVRWWILMWLSLSMTWSWNGPNFWIARGFLGAVYGDRSQKSFGAPALLGPVHWDRPSAGHNWPKTQILSSTKRQQVVNITSFDDLWYSDFRLGVEKWLFLEKSNIFVMVQQICDNLLLDFGTEILPMVHDALYENDPPILEFLGPVPVHRYQKLWSAIVVQIKWWILTRYSTPDSPTKDILRY